MPPKHGRKDLNQDEIVDTLRGIGAVVYITNDKGVGDLFVWFRGGWYNLETKGRKGTLTDAQVKFHAQVGPDGVIIVRDSDAALRAIGAID